MSQGRQNYQVRIKNLHYIRDDSYCLFKLNQLCGGLIHQVWINISDETIGLMWNKIGIMKTSLSFHNGSWQASV